MWTVKTLEDIKVGEAARLDLFVKNPPLYIIPFSRSFFFTISYLFQ